MNYILGAIIAILLAVFTYNTFLIQPKSIKDISVETNDSDIETIEATETPIPTPTSKQYYQPTFNGYPCTEDCSGHEAGYEWAEENDISDPDDCGGNSDSFIEGCQSWAEEQESTDDEEDYYYDEYGEDY